MWTESFLCTELHVHCVCQAIGSQKLGYWLILTGSKIYLTTLYVRYLGKLLMQGHIFSCGPLICRWWFLNFLTQKVLHRQSHSRIHQILTYLVTTGSPCSHIALCSSNEIFSNVARISHLVCTLCCKSFTMNNNIIFIQFGHMDAQICISHYVSCFCNIYTVMVSIMLWCYDFDLLC